MAISAQKVAADLEVAPYSSNVYFNIKTGEVYVLTDDIECSIRAHRSNPDQSPDWIKEEAAKFGEVKKSPDWQIILPNEVLEPYRTMERFIVEKTQDKERDQLLRAITGKGAFRRFEATAHRLGLISEWYEYRSQRYQQLTADWLEAQNIPFEP